MDKPVSVWSARGLSKKVRRLGLSVDEATQLRQSVDVLNSMSISVLEEQGVVRKVADDFYFYDVDHGLRIMVGIIEKDGKQVPILYDIVRLEKKAGLVTAFGNFVKKFAGRTKQVGSQRASLLTRSVFPREKRSFDRGKSLLVRTVSR